MRLKTFLKKSYGWLKRVPLKKFKEVRYKVWLNSKQISFKDRDEKLRLVEEILEENPNIYFTSGLVKTGFTDQLMGFDFLYKLGKGVGLKYFHTPLSAHRSSDPFLFDPITQKQKVESKENSPQFDDIFDFLGINKYLEKMSSSAVIPGRQIPLNLNLTLYGREGIDSYESLIEEMKVILYPFLKKNKSILIIFQTEPKTYFHYYRYTCDHKKHEIDYNSCYRSNKNKNQGVSEFSTDLTNVLVHIRQGDTGTIETPWKTYIPVWHETEGKFKQFQNDRDIPGHKRIYPEEFYQFIKELQGEIAKKKLQTVVFSDGYKKAFRWIYKYFREKDISLEEIEKLKELEQNYDELQFGKFNDLENTKTVIGEDIDKLYRLVDSFFDADILVTGTQATMIPKLAATYGRKAKMPLLILLYHTQKPSLEYVGFNDSSPFLMFVNLEDYDISKVSNEVLNYLEARGIN